jgi:NitT/TauT family transport system permease protein
MAAKRNLNRWAPWIFLAALLTFWELGVRLFGIDEFVLPSASSSFRALYDNFGPIMKNTWPTFWTTMVGFGLGIVVGALLGVIIG